MDSSKKSLEAQLATFKTVTANLLTATQSLVDIVAPLVPHGKTNLMRIAIQATEQADALLFGDSIHLARTRAVIRIRDLGFAPKTDAPVVPALTVVK